VIEWDFLLKSLISDGRSRRLIRPFSSYLFNSTQFPDLYQVKHYLSYLLLFPGFAVSMQCEKSNTILFLFWRMAKQNLACQPHDGVPMSAPPESLGSASSAAFSAPKYSNMKVICEFSQVHYISFTGLAHSPLSCSCSSPSFASSMSPWLHP
jgi:hypothetical protein